MQNMLSFKLRDIFLIAIFRKRRNLHDTDKKIAVHSMNLPSSGTWYEHKWWGICRRGETRSQDINHGPE